MALVVDADRNSGGVKKASCPLNANTDNTTSTSTSKLGKEGLWHKRLKKKQPEDNNGAVHIRAMLLYQVERNTLKNGMGAGKVVELVNRRYGNIPSSVKRLPISKQPSFTKRKGTS